MSDIIKLEIVAGTFLTYVKKGTEVGEDPDPVNIVGPGFFPAGDSGVWQSWGDVPDAVLELRFKDLPPRVQHLPEGGSWEQTGRRLIGATVKFQPFDMTHESVRMIHAVKATLASNTPAAPLRDQDPHMECWLNWQNRIDGGVDVTKLALYGRTRIEGSPTWGGVDRTRPAYAHEVHPSSIASLVALGLFPA
jgi:hypothetical protein